MRERKLISNGNPMEITVGSSRAVRVGSFIAVGGTILVSEALTSRMVSNSIQKSVLVSVLLAAGPNRF